MSSSSEEIRISDLADPVLTPVQQGARDGAEKFPVELSEEVILGEAVERTGLSDFGAEDFRTRLGVQLESVNEDEGLGAVGRISVYRDLVRYAANRLRFEDLLNRTMPVDQRHDCLVQRVEAICLPVLQKEHDLDRITLNRNPLLTRTDFRCIKVVLLHHKVGGLFQDRGLIFDHLPCDRIKFYFLCRISLAMEGQQG